MNKLPIEKVINTIIQGDILKVLKTLPSNSINVIITSPPYWGLRDYGEDTKTIWDGDKDCKHERIEGKTAGDFRCRAGRTTIVGSNKNPDIWVRPSRTEYASRKAKNICPVCDKEFEGKPQQKFCSIKCLNTLSNKDRTLAQRNANFCFKCGAWHGQLGLEPTLDLYINHLLQITTELKRVLKKTGVMFWNHGDSYSSSTSRKAQFRNRPELEGCTSWGKRDASISIPCDIPTKSLCLQNHRLILQMIDDQGWILRNTIIWHKPNAMPTSVKDRFSNTYEPVFILVKNSNPVYYYNEKTGQTTDKSMAIKDGKKDIDWRWVKHIACDGKGCDKCIGGKIKRSYWRSVDYWFNLDAVRKPHKQSSIDRLFRGSSEDNKYSGESYGGKQPSHTMNKPRKRIPKEIRPAIKEELYHQQSIIPSGGSYKKTSNMLTNLQKSILTSGGKNPGDLWIIPTQPFPEAHFATFPEKLVEPMIKSSCPKWICKKCGKARVKITKIKQIVIKEFRDKGKGKEVLEASDKRSVLPRTRTGAETRASHQTIGWTNCGCNAGWISGITLDPFVGAGTTCIVAKRLGMNYIYWNRY